jgi:anti-anti-sigma factor
VEESGHDISIVASPLAGEAVLLTVNGDLDIDTAGRFREHLTALVQERRPSRLDLDLSGVGFCDLIGLRALLELGDDKCEIPARIVAPGPNLDLLMGLCEIGTLLGYRPAPAERRHGAAPPR